jgi:putative ABC transport system permease protein
VKLRRGVGLSLGALFARKVRAVLALSCVSVGVAAVMLTSAIGAGAQREVLRRVEGMGTNMLIVRPTQVKKLTSRKAIRGFVTTLTLEDYEAVLGSPLVEEVAPSVEGSARVKAGGTVIMTTVRGTTPGYLGVRRFRLGAGRFFDADDEAAARRVAVLAARVATSLFPGEDPVGREVRVRGVAFTVVGVLQPKGVLADGSDEDNLVLVPLRTALRRVFNVEWLSSMFVSVIDAASMEKAERETRALIRAGHRVSREGKADDFEVQNSARFLAVLQETAKSLSQLTTGLAAIALLLGGTGILALMLMSVKERTGEIGLRMAVGARPRDVFVQFLFEAILLALAGWLAGLALAAPGAAAVAFATGWPVAVPTGAMLASLGMAIVIGVGAGALPARKASVIPPITALLAE